MSGHTVTKMLTLLFASLALVAHAQTTATGPSTELRTGSGQAYPSRPVRVIVPLAAGGGMDAVTRSLALNLTDSLGQSVIVDNRPGAGSHVALEILASAAPDGHTLMMLSATTVIHPLLYHSRFDIVRDFVPVSQVTAQGYVLVTHPSLPVKSALELVKYARANPGKLNYSSSGIGSPIHMTTELFQVATGTQMIHIPYKGMGAAYADLVGGRINFSFATIISSQVHINGGRLRALAIVYNKRFAGMPEVPTTAEAGVAGVDAPNWYGIVVPAGTPRAIIGRLNREIVAMLKTPEMTRQLLLLGAEPRPQTPEEFGEFMRQEVDRWAKVIKAANIKPE